MEVAEQSYPQAAQSLGPTRNRQLLASDPDVMSFVEKAMCASASQNPDASHTQSTQDVTAGESSGEGRWRHS